jgi:hypothetical protein
MRGELIPSKPLVQPTRPWGGSIPTAGGRLLDRRSWDQDSTLLDNGVNAP